MELDKRQEQYIIGNVVIVIEIPLRRALEPAVSLSGDDHFIEEQLPIAANVPS